MNLNQETGTNKKWTKPAPKKKTVTKPKKKESTPDNSAVVSTTPITPGSSNMDITVPTTTTTTPTTTTTTSSAALEKLWANANNYKAQMDVLLKQGFKYNPNTDPSYQSIQTLSKKNAKLAKNNAMETMNDRGILNSTITSDRMGQIEQTAQDAVTAQVPALQNAAYGRYMDKINQLNSLWSATISQANTERAYNLEIDKYNTSKDQWNQEFDYRKGQDAINNQFEQDRIQLSYYDYDIRKAAQAQDAVGFRDEQSTQNAIAELLTYKTADDAMKQLRANVNLYISKGANISDIINTLEKVWPGFEDKAAKTSTENMFDDPKK